MKKLFLIFFVALISLIGISFTPPGERYFEIARNLDIFATLFKEVNATYVDEVNPNTLIRTGIDAMLNSLDPYTNYIPEDEVEDFRKEYTRQYGGIGAITLQMRGRMVVTMIMEGFIAQKAGLKIGDEIIKVDNVDITKLSREEADKLLKGQLGTTLKLTVKRPGVAEPIDLELKREKIKEYNVPYSSMLTADVGYIQLVNFTPDASKEVKSALEQLKIDGAKSIILDLRGNPGGLLLEAVNICNIFIPKGKKVVSTMGKTTENNLTYETLNNPLDIEIPLTVLINRSSASASEIVAGTLQDYDRAVIIGEKSYGKGLVQVSRQLSYNSQLKVTTAKYYTPTGRCIQVLDYTHRRDDGSVASIPDSLKSVFKTSNGRTVYDGGGIEPDIKTEPLSAHTLTRVLFENGYIFDYATEYTLNHPTIPAASAFKLSDEDYLKFVNWMRTKKYTYISKIEKDLNSLKDEAKKERYYNELKPQLDGIEARIAETKKNELILHKSEIKMMLEEEIAARYYLERGAVEVSFKYDQDIKKAIDLLGNLSQYKKILNVR